jgi:hypothetical protein
MPRKRTSRPKLFAVVKIDGTTLPAPSFHEWAKFSSYVSSQVLAGTSSFEFVSLPTQKNASYCVWVRTDQFRFQSYPALMCNNEQRELMALAAKGPGAPPVLVAPAPKRPSAKKDRIKVWLGGDLPARGPNRSRIP